MFVKHGCPGGNKVKIWQKSLSPIFWPAPPQGHVMSVKCEEPINEITIQVCLHVSSPELKILHFVSKTGLWTDRRTIWLLDAPGGPPNRGLGLYDYSLLSEIFFAIWPYNIKLSLEGIGCKSSCILLLLLGLSKVKWRRYLLSQVT